MTKLFTSLTSLLIPIASFGQFEMDTTAYNSSNSCLQLDFSDQIEVDSNDVVYLNSGNSVIAFDGATCTVYDTSTVAGFDYSTVDEMVMQKNNKLWITHFWAFGRPNFASFDGVTWKFDFLNYPTNVRNIALDKQDNLWFTGSPQDVWQESIVKRINDSTWSHFAMPDSFSYPEDMCFDLNNDLWILEGNQQGTELAKFSFSDSSWTLWDKGSHIQLDSADYETIHILHDGKALLASGSGTYPALLFDGSTFELFEDVSGFTAHVVTDVEIVNSTTWISCFNGSGMIRYKDGSFEKMYVNDSPIFSFGGVEIDSEGNLWSVGFSDLYKIHELSGSSAVTENSSEKTSLFPNPASEQLNLSNVSSGSFFQIFDLSGKLLQSGAYNGNAVSISNLSAGSYVLKVLGENEALHFIKQ